MKFSTSMIKEFGTCALRGKFRYIDGLPDQTGSSAVFGSAVHAGLEAFHLGADLAEAQRVFLDYLDNNEPDYWNRRTTYTGFKSKGLQMIEDYVSARRWSESTILAAEMRFMVDMGEHQLSGIVDYLEVPDDMSYLKIGDLKGLALDTPLPTPTGWTTMRDVQVGDELFGSDGQPCTVIAKSQVHYKPTYRVSFDDGTSIVCDNEHYWSVVSGKDPAQYKEQVLTTTQLRDTLFTTGRRPQRQHRIPNAKPLELPERSLPLHPYVLGYWLGNGKHTSGEITSSDDEVFQRFIDLGYTVGGDISSSTTEKGKCSTRTVYGIRGALSDLNVLGNKHVPEEYLRSSRWQRLELLRGLMDADGTWNIARNQCNFTSTTEVLADAVLELVHSLGWHGNKWSGPYKGFGVTGTAYYVNFTPFDDVPFHLDRKASQVCVEGTAKARRRLIHSIERIPTVATQCIMVDSPDHTYLCGEQMVPTHNTGKKPNMDNLHLDLQFSVYDWASRQPEFWMGYKGQEDKYPGLPNGEELYEIFKDVPRKLVWYDLRGNREIDVGERTERDYGRLYRCCEQIARAVEYEVFIPTVNGDNCTWCSYQDVCPVSWKNESESDIVTEQ